VLLVVAEHTWRRPGGAAFGVDVFFVLSGFLITTLLLEEHIRYGRISLTAFYRRRAYRILPAMWLLVAVVTIGGATGLIHEAARNGSKWWHGALAAAFFLGNVSTAFQVFGWVPTDLGQLWSLAEEDQFYLVWPVLLIAALAVRSKPRHLVILLSAVASFSIARQFALWHTLHWRPRMWMGPDTHLEPLAVGCLSAVILSYRLIDESRYRRLWIPAAIVCVLIIATARLGYDYMYDGPFALFPVMCAIVLLAAVTSSGVLSTVFSFGPLRGVGKISYGLYLYHLPLVFHFGVIGVPMSFAAALASYHFVELPFLRRKRASRTARMLPKPVATPA
jgi:peptidoglycan/LPS O-acetylase OafA/YrhL